MIFCGSALGICLLIAVVAFPFAAMSKAQVTTANSVVSAEQLGEMELGDFGKISVLDLVSYYMENPPEVGSAAPKKIRFEGC